MNRKGEFLNGIEIIAYRNARDLDVLFSDGTIVTNTRYAHFKNNNIKNPNAPNVFGIGFTGVGVYNHKDNRKMSQTWMSMLQRSYSLAFHELHPTYIGCSVHSDWHNYQVFAKWFEENYVEGFHLDKDFTLIGNKQYSANTCKFIPSEINVILTNCIDSKGVLGVSLRKNGKYQASLCVNNKRVYLGVFNSEKEGFDIYKTAKESYIKEQADKYRKDIGEVIYNNLINYIVKP